jgi:hypothetical protein
MCDRMRTRFGWLARSAGIALMTLATSAPAGYVAPSFTLLYPTACFSSVKTAPVACSDLPLNQRLDDWCKIGKNV